MNENIFCGDFKNTRTNGKTNVVKIRKYYRPFSYNKTGMLEEKIWSWTRRKLFYPTHAE